MDFRADRWAELINPAAFSARYYHRMCVGNGYMYLTGGYASGVASSEVWRSADGETWTLLTAAPGWGARGCHGCLFLNGRIYVFGGSNEGGTYYSDCWSSADGISWIQETAAGGWGSRHQMGYCVHDNKLYISGGYNPAGGGVGTFYSDVWSSTNGSVWSLVSSDFGANIRQHSMISFLGDLWIYGGNDSNVGPHNEIRQSTNDGVNWSLAGSMGFLRYDMTAIVNDTATQLALIGGRTNIGAYVDVHVTNDGTTVTGITQITPYENTQSQAVLFNNTLFTVGGRYGSTDRNDVWKEQYQVAYNDNGAPGSSAPVDSTLYDAINTPTVLGPGAMSWYGHTFNRWNTLPNGTGTDYNPSDLLTFADSGVVTLYAIWDIVPIDFHVEATGSNTFPYDTRDKAATNFHELFDGLYTNASIDELEALWTVYVYGEITEPADEWDWFEGNGAPIIGESSQTTIIDMDTSSFETVGVYNCTFFTDNPNADWNTCIYDPYEVVNCKFDGYDYWYEAIEYWYTGRDVRVIGNSFENLKDYSIYIRENSLTIANEVIVVNNSLDNPTAIVELIIELLNCTLGKLHFYNNISKRNTFTITLTSMTISEFLHDHNISNYGYNYTEDTVWIPPDVTELETDPLFLYTDPNNRLAINDTSPAHRAGIMRSDVPSVDLTGLAFANPPSEGAYEYGTTPCPNLPPMNPNRWMDIALVGMVYDSTTLSLSTSGKLSTFGYHTFEGSVSNIITDHVARGLSLLITQFRRTRPENSLPNPNNMINILTPFLQQVQLVEYMESDLDTLRWLDTAVGVQLDGLGEILQLPRNGRTDFDYRIALKFQVYINRSSGEPEVIIAFVKDFTNATKVRLQEAYPAGLFIFTDGTTVLTNFNLVEAIEEILAAGVKLRGIFYLDPDAVYFTFDWDGLPIDPQYKGFDELNYLEGGDHVGGQLFELII